MQTLFDFDRPASLAKDAPRLNGQCLAIIERLQKGRATNMELAAISLKYTSRISDCRKAGCDIACVSQDRKTGLSVYELRNAADWQGADKPTVRREVREEE